MYVLATQAARLPFCRTSEYDCTEHWVYIYALGLRLAYCVEAAEGPCRTGPDSD